MMEDNTPSTMTAVADGDDNEDAGTTLFVFDAFALLFDLGFVSSMVLIRAMFVVTLLSGGLGKINVDYHSAEISHTTLSATANKKFGKAGVYYSRGKHHKPPIPAFRIFFHPDLFSWPVHEIGSRFYRFRTGRFNNYHGAE